MEDHLKKALLTSKKIKCKSDLQYYHAKASSGMWGAAQGDKAGNSR
jgi:hypothetical protein